MPEKPEVPKKLPAYSSLDELVRFFEENDMGDYLDAMPEVHFDVKLKNKRVRIESGEPPQTRNRRERT